MFTARFTFSQDRAHEFLEDGRQVDQQDYDGVQDIIEFTKDFEDALEDVNVYCHTTGRTINLSDFTFEA